MKKDKYEELKPEAFQYQDDKSTPSLMFGAISAIFAMIGFIIFFVMFVMTLFSQVANII